MELNTSSLSFEHLAISPLDGRYHSVGETLSPYFSEFALVKNKVKVEVLWLKFLIENKIGSEILNGFDKKKLPEVLKIWSDFSDEDFIEVKKIEAVTNHDTKAVELFVAKKLENLGLQEYVSFVHIGCTSEDISNSAYSAMVSSALGEVWIPAAEKLVSNLSKMAKAHTKTAMLAHTHGQPATPTTVGKELAVFVYRLNKSLENIKQVKLTAKFNGATGTYAAIDSAFPKKDWRTLSKKFIEEYLELNFNPLTTQIESHDNFCHLFDGIRHFNNVLLDLDQDMWLYISMEYFKQIVVKNEVGSSTMPHKVNPIRFENSEANISMANALLLELSNKLPKSRMQRDLSDSSALRNIGVAFGYSLQAILQTVSGLEKVEVNKAKLKSELETKWEVLAESIQTMLRKYGVPDAYNKLKELTRGKDISKQNLQKFVKSLKELSDEDKKTLLKLTPETYIGLAETLANEEI